MMNKFKKYKDFLYFLYQPNKRVLPLYFEFYIEKDTDDVLYPFDSLLSFASVGCRQTKEIAEQKAKELIERYYTNPNVKEMFDRIRE